VGVYYSRSAAKAFLKASGFRKLIRAHECVASGLSVTGPTITVFSSSNYCGQHNTAAFLFLNRGGFLRNMMLDPLAGITEREKARYGAAPDFPDLKPVQASKSAERVKLRPLIVKPDDSKGIRREALRFILQGGESARVVNEIPPNAPVAARLALRQKGFVSNRNLRSPFVVAA
jgi:hypothetical protein